MSFQDPFSGNAWANGTMGSMMPASQTNATNEKKSSGNPFTDVLNHVTAFNANTSGGAASPGGFTGQAPAPGGDLHVFGPGQTSGPSQGMPTGGYAPQPTSQQPPSNALSGGDLHIFGPTSTSNYPTSTPQQMPPQQQGAYPSAPPQPGPSYPSPSTPTLDATQPAAGGASSSATPFAPQQPSMTQGFVPSQSGPTPTQTAPRSGGAPPVVSMMSTVENPTDPGGNGGGGSGQSSQAWTNPIPKPQNPNDLEGMAAYYRGFANDPNNGDPVFSTITGDMIGQQRNLAMNGVFADMGHPEWNDFGTWMKAGLPQYRYGMPAPDNSLANANLGTDTVDGKGVPYGPNNLPPKPPNTEDSEVAAAWYRKHQFLNPAFANITGKDVDRYRISGYQGDFKDWYLNGQPSPAQQPPPTGGGTQQLPPGLQTVTTPINYETLFPGTPYTEDYLLKLSPEQLGQMITPAALAALQTKHPDKFTTPDTAPPPPVVTPPTTASGGAGGVGSGGTGTVTNVLPGGGGGAGGAGGANTGTSSTEEIQKLMDLFKGQQANGPTAPPLEDLLNPMFSRQRQNLIGDINAAGAAEGSIGSGGFGANRDQAVSNLAGQQSAALAGQLGEEYLARVDQQTKLTQLATEAGMQTFLGELNNDLERYKVVTNRDLQIMLSDKDNALKKYGIDSNDVMQRYIAKYNADQQLTGVKYSADASISAAQLHAAAAASAAAAGAGAAMYGADKQYQLGMAGLGVDREKNIGNFILGLLGLGNTQLGNLNDIFSGFPPGSIVVKP